MARRQGGGGGARNRKVRKFLYLRAPIANKIQKKKDEVKEIGQRVTRVEEKVSLREENEIQEVFTTVSNIQRETTQHSPST